MLLLMASTVSFHSDSFIAKIDVIFPFMVAWKRVRKVDKSLDRGLYFGALLAATIRLAYIQCWLRHLTLFVPQRKAVCKIVLLANFFHSSPMKSCEQLIRQRTRLRLWCGSKQPENLK